MAGRESIEALAVHFTAGVAAGTLLLRLPANLSVLASSLLFTLAALVIILLKTNRSGLLFPAFLLLGASALSPKHFPARRRRPYWSDGHRHGRTGCEGSSTASLSRPRARLPC